MSTIRQTPENAVRLLPMINPSRANDTGIWFKILGALKNCGVDYEIAENWSMTDKYSDKVQIKNAWNNNTAKSGIGTLIYYAKQDSGPLNYAEFETTTAASSTAQTQTQEIPADLVAANKRFTELQKQSKPNFIHYNFTDENGKIIVQEVRLERPGQKKQIRQRRPAPGIEKPRNSVNADWINNLKGIDQIPLFNAYNPIVIKAKTVFYLEGSKDCLTALVLGMPAVTNIGGGGHISTTDFSPLCGKDVIIIPDNDDTGYKAALKVYDVLLQIANSVKIIKLPTDQQKADLTDYVDLIAGQTGGVA